MRTAIVFVVLTPTKLISVEDKKVTLLFTALICIKLIVWLCLVSIVLAGISVLVNSDNNHNSDIRLKFYPSIHPSIQAVHRSIHSSIYPAILPAMTG